MGALWGSVGGVTGVFRQIIAEPWGGVLRRCGSKEGLVIWV